MTSNLHMNRRTLLVASAALSLLGSQPALAQAYPSQPIKVVVPYPAGGATDVLARLFSQKLQESWAQTVVVENRPGAGGTIGAGQVAKAPADGHTVLFSIVALLQQITLMKLPYDPMKDFQPITRVAVSPSVLAVPKDTPARDLKEFLASVKANPGKTSFGTYGAGTSSHLQGALLNMQAGLDMVHVPFQGGAPLVNAMLGGQLGMAFLDAGTSRPHLDKFKLFGTTGPARLAWLANVPTLKEQGLHSYEPMGWFGMFLPAGTPKAVVDKFSAEALRILALPDVRERIEAMGLIPAADTPQAFAEVMRIDAALYAKIIKDANISLN